MNTENLNEQSEFTVIELGIISEDTQGGMLEGREIDQTFQPVGLTE